MQLCLGGFEALNLNFFITPLLMVVIWVVPLFPQLGGDLSDLHGSVMSPGSLRRES